jgi:DnaK suppressor protein
LSKAATAKPAPPVPVEAAAPAPVKRPAPKPAPPPKPTRSPVFPADSHRPFDPDDLDSIETLDEPEFLAQQRTLLLRERSTYSEQALMLRAEADELAAEMEPGDVQFDDESGEGATTSIERERDLAMSAAALSTVEEIDQALKRLTLGTYGVCLSCGEPVARPRLRALPHVGLCIRCKSGGLSRR